MKYCNKCGTSLEDDLAFCVMCGARVEPLGEPMTPPSQQTLYPNQSLPVCEQSGQPGWGNPVTQQSFQPGWTMPTPPPAAPPPKKKRKGLLVIVLCLCVLLIAGAVAGIFVLQWYQDPQQQLDRALKARDWEQVIELARQEPDLCEDNRVIAVLEDRVAELAEEYQNGEIRYDAYIQELTGLEDMNPEALGLLIDQAEVEAQVLKEYSDHYDEAQSYMRAGDYASAIESYSMVMGGPLYEQAQADCAEAKNALRQQVLEEAAALAEEGKYTQAEERVAEGLKLLPHDEDLLQRQETYLQTLRDQKREDTLLQAEQYVKQEKYPAAFRLLRDYQDEMGSDSKISDALSQYEDAYVSAMIEKANTYAQEHRFEEAFRVLEEAKKELPENSRLTTAGQEIEKLQPVSLGKLQPVDSYRWNPNEVRLEDCLGNEFYDSVNAFVPDHEGYALFPINGAYTRITGQLSSLWVQKRESFFLIYADDELLYYSRGITPATVPFTFDVAIPEGTQQIKLTVVSDAFDNSSILLTDAYLWP